MNERESAIYSRRNGELGSETARQDKVGVQGCPLVETAGLTQIVVQQPCWMKVAVGGKEKRKFIYRF